MKVVFQHDGILPVIKYGGIERIIFWHMKELVRQGHEVVLIGHPESNVKEFGIELIPIGQGDWRELIPSDSDIIHLFYNHEPDTKIPTINTIQGNGKIGEEFSKNTVFISKKHAENHGSQCFIYNAIDLSEYEFDQNKKLDWENFLFLAKGSWSVKNLKHCKQACKKSKKHLHIAGGKSWWPNRYMHSYGMVGGDEKMQIIKKCDAILWPVRWHEPFGIAVIEAMAYGLPVIASPYGSLPELVADGRAGVIVNNYSELESNIRKMQSQFDPKDIRKYVEENFSIEKHTKSFVETYQRVINGEVLNEKSPTWQLKQEAVELLPF